MLFFILRIRFIHQMNGRRGMVRCVHTPRRLHSTNTPNDLSPHTTPKADVLSNETLPASLPMFRLNLHRELATASEGFRHEAQSHLSQTHGETVASGASHKAAEQIERRRQKWSLAESEFDVGITERLFPEIRRLSILHELHYGDAIMREVDAATYFTTHKDEAEKDAVKETETHGVCLGTHTNTVESLTPPQGLSDADLLAFDAESNTSPPIGSETDKANGKVEVCDEEKREAEVEEEGEGGMLSVWPEVSDKTVAHGVDTPWFVPLGGVVRLEPLTQDDLHRLLRFLMHLRQQTTAQLPATLRRKVQAMERGEAKHLLTLSEVCAYTQTAPPPVLGFTENLPPRLSPAFVFVLYSENISMQNAIGHMAALFSIPQRAFCTRTSGSKMSSAAVLCAVEANRLEREHLLLLNTMRHPGFVLRVSSIQPWEGDSAALFGVIARWQPLHEVQLLLRRAHCGDDRNHSDLRSELAHRLRAVQEVGAIFFCANREASLARAAADVLHGFHKSALINALYRRRAPLQMRQFLARPNAITAARALRVSTDATVRHVLRSFIRHNGNWSQVVASTPYMWRRRWINALRCAVWNRMASRRLRLGGRRVIPGDIVLRPQFRVDAQRRALTTVKAEHVMLVPDEAEAAQCSVEDIYIPFLRGIFPAELFAPKETNHPIMTHENMLTLLRDVHAPQLLLGMNKACQQLLDIRSEVSPLLFRRFILRPVAMRFEILEDKPPVKSIHFDAARVLRNDRLALQQHGEGEQACQEGEDAQSSKRKEKHLQRTSPTHTEVETTVDGTHEGKNMHHDHFNGEEDKKNGIHVHIHDTNMMREGNAKENTTLPSSFSRQDEHHGEEGEEENKQQQQQQAQQEKEPSPPPPLLLPSSSALFPRDLILERTTIGSRLSTGLLAEEFFTLPSRSDYATLGHVHRHIGGRGGLVLASPQTPNEVLRSIDRVYSVHVHALVRHGAAALGQLLREYFILTGVEREEESALQHKVHRIRRELDTETPRLTAPSFCPACFCTSHDNTEACAEYQWKRGRQLGRQKREEALAQIAATESTNATALVEGNVSRESLDNVHVIWDLQLRRGSGGQKWGIRLTPALQLAGMDDLAVLADSTLRLRGANEVQTTQQLTEALVRASSATKSEGMTALSKFIEKATAGESYALSKEVPLTHLQDVMPRRENPAREGQEHQEEGDSLLRRCGWVLTSVDGTAVSGRKQVAAAFVRIGQRRDVQLRLTVTMPSEIFKPLMASRSHTPSLPSSPHADPSSTAEKVSTARIDLPSTLNLQLTRDGGARGWGLRLGDHSLVLLNLPSLLRSPRTVTYPPPVETAAMEGRYALRRVDGVQVFSREDVLRHLQNRLPSDGTLNVELSLLSHAEAVASSEVSTETDSFDTQGESPTPSSGDVLQTKETSEQTDSVKTMEMLAPPSCSPQCRLLTPIQQNKSIITIVINRHSSAAAGRWGLRVRRGSVRLMRIQHNAHFTFQVYAAKQTQAVRVSDTLRYSGTRRLGPRRGTQDLNRVEHNSHNNTNSDENGDETAASSYSPFLYMIIGVNHRPVMNSDELHAAIATAAKSGSEALVLQVRQHRLAQLAVQIRREDDTEPIGLSVARDMTIQSIAPGSVMARGVLEATNAQCSLRRRIAEAETPKPSHSEWEFDLDEDVIADSKVTTPVAITGESLAQWDMIDGIDAITAYGPKKDSEVADQYAWRLTYAVRAGPLRSTQDVARALGVGVREETVFLQQCVVDE